MVLCDRQSVGAFRTRLHPLVMLQLWRSSVIIMIGLAGSAGKPRTCFSIGADPTALKVEVKAFPLRGQGASIYDVLTEGG